MKTFRAWIDYRGSNENRPHARHLAAGRKRCRHIRMVDLETTPKLRILIRVMRRRHPILFQVLVFFRADRGTTVFRIGRKWSEAV